MLRNDILGQLDAYHSSFVEEMAFRRKAIDHIKQEKQVFTRSVSLHMTGSAWVVNQDLSKVLLLLHVKLGQWFQPGGHADGNHDLINVSMNEIVEETGIDSKNIRLLSERIFDLDIHTIPSLPGEPLHQHIDIRYLMQINDQVPVPGNHESHEIRWVPLEQVMRYNNNRSTFRMLDKTRRLRRYGLI